MVTKRQADPCDDVRRGISPRRLLALATIAAASCGIDVQGAGQAVPADASIPSSDAGGLDAGAIEDRSAPGDGGSADSGCGDLGSDPHNCGACAHDCLGGTCSGGVCGPVVLAKVANPRHMVLADFNLYVTSHTSNGGVYEVPIGGVPDGGSPRAVLANISNPNRIALGAGYVYFGLDNSSATVRRCAVAPGVSCDILASSQDTPTGVTTDGTNLYWSESGLGNVNRCPIEGCNGGPTRVVSGLNVPTGIAIDGNTVVFAEEGTAPGYTNGRILSAAADSYTGSPNELARGERAPLFVVIQKAVVYWGGLASAPGANDAQIKSCPMSGCALGPAVFADRQASLGDLLIDGSDLYWSRNGGGAGDGVYTCPLAGCPPSGPKLVALDPDARGIAVDGKAVYWGSYQDNAVHRVAR